MTNKCESINESFNDFQIINDKNKDDVIKDNIYKKYNETRKSKCNDSHFTHSLNYINNMDCVKSTIDYCNKTYNDDANIQKCFDELSKHMRITKVTQSNVAQIISTCKLTDALNNKYLNIASNLKEPLDCNNDNIKQIVENKFNLIEKCSNDITSIQQNILIGICGANNVNMTNNFKSKNECITNILKLNEPNNEPNNAPNNAPNNVTNNELNNKSKDNNKDNINNNVNNNLKLIIGLCLLIFFIIAFVIYLKYF